jgi:DNA polymerase (family 10)
LPSSTPRRPAQHPFGKTFRILKGIEADILGDGSLDYPDRVLRKFDFVVASVHSRFRMSKKAQTSRILKAIANPYTTILGHMTGRELTRRQGYEVEIDKVLKACADHGVAVEINAHPWRLDLDWRWHEKALSYGCIFSINPDAHSHQGARPHPLGCGNGPQGRRTP